MELQLEVSPEDRGQDALTFVAGELEDFLEHFLKKLFKGGHVRCGPRVVREDQLLPPGTCLTVEIPDHMVPNIGPKPHKLDYVMEDERMLAVDKPAGLSMLPGLGFEQITLFEAVWHHLKGTGDRPRIVNRIDKGTSGLVLFAKNAAAQSHLAQQFQRREVTKLYRALVVGRIPEETGEVDLPVAPHPARPEMMVIDRKNGKAAQTRWTVRRRFAHYTELDLMPLTGRTHQLRVHLKAIGHPLAVDPVYGSDKPLMLSQIKKGYRHKDGEERPLLARTPLHALSLTFRHPADDRSMTLEAPLHKDMEVTLKQLAKWDAS
jgi:23S rRNA pseudouridine1911/1915/1917 synthase